MGGQVQAQEVGSGSWGRWALSSSVSLPCLGGHAGYVAPNTHTNTHTRGGGAVQPPAEGRRPGLTGGRGGVPVGSRDSVSSPAVLGGVCEGKVGCMGRSRVGARGARKRPWAPSGGQTLQRSSGGWATAATVGGSGGSPRWDPASTSLHPAPRLPPAVPAPGPRPRARQRGPLPAPRAPPPPAGSSCRWLRPRPNFQATVSRRRRAGRLRRPRLRPASRGGPAEQGDGSRGLRGRRRPGWAASGFPASVPGSLNRDGDRGFEGTAAFDPPLPPRTENVGPVWA